tara:strand:+ start:11192 stop:11515 length:324 start_codon:yes stop_codon:yes gene_type:complete
LKFFSFLLFAIFGFTAVYASFPVVENLSIEPVSEIYNNSDLNSLGKVFWFLSGVVSWGVPIAIIYQIISKKKGPIKFALLGFLAVMLFLIILIIVSFGDIENPFIFG